VLLTGTDTVYHGAGSESDSSDHLIVDESKAMQRPQLKPGSLKMRLPGTAGHCAFFADYGIKF